MLFQIGFISASSKIQNSGQISSRVTTSCSHPQLDVSKNSGTPKSSILIGFSIINLPFWGAIIFGNTQLMLVIVFREVSLQIPRNLQGWEFLRKILPTWMEEKPEKKSIRSTEEDEFAVSFFCHLNDSLSQWTLRKRFKLYFSY